MPLCDLCVILNALFGKKNTEPTKYKENTTQLKERFDLKHSSCMRTAN